MNLKKVNSLKLDDRNYPEALGQIINPPQEIFYAGAEPSSWEEFPKVAIVGSRKMTAYGKEVTTRLASELAQAGAVVISGLALGVDASAHESALKAGGLCVAVLPTSLNNIYPASHRNMAERIISSGGTLISEYRADAEIYITNFVARNRIVSALADVLVITEAAVKSGSLHTARFALEQGKTVMAVPGNITSPTSEGCNNLIKAGAIPVTVAEDVFFALRLNPKKRRVKRSFSGSETEQRLLELISSGVNSQEELVLASRYETAEVSGALTMLEISGHIRPQGGGNWTLA